MVETELAWAAGIWDGEGCTSLMRSRPNAKPTIRMSVSQKYSAHVIQRFYEAVGRRGKLTTRTRNKGPEGTIYIWRTNSQQVIEQVIELLWPYLSQPKRDQYIRCLNAARS